MKIIQLNAWLGRLSGPVARFISEQNADVVCIQEAYIPNKDAIAAIADQYNFLDELVRVGNYKYQSFAKNWAMPVAGAEIIEGNVILSRYPITSEHTEHTFGKYHVRNSSADCIANTRIWQSCSVQANNGIFTVANYQGYLSGIDPMGDGTTLETIKKVIKFIDSLPRPLIVCGDFNVSPSSDSMKLLSSKLRNLTLENNINTTLSKVHRAPLKDRESVACDYILVSDDINVKSFVVSEEVVSDHKALILEFDI